METIISVTEAYRQQLQSAHMEGWEAHQTTADSYRVDPVKGQPTTTRLPVVWAFKGEKRFRQQREVFDRKGQQGRFELANRTMTEMFDGEHQYSFVNTQHTNGEGDIGSRKEAVQGIIQQSNFTLVLPLSVGPQVYGKWVAESLRSGQYTLKGTVQDLRHGLLYQFDGSTGSSQGTRLWLAPKYEFLAVRTEFETQVHDRHQLTVRELDRAEQHGSLWFPVAGTVRHFEIEGNKRTLLIQSQFQVDHLELNNVPDSLFQPQIKPGYYMKDAATNQYWKVGSNGEKIFMDISKPEDSGEMRYGWLFMLSATTLLGLGVTTLWRRRRRVAS